jgi:hypothetical protein
MTTATAVRCSTLGDSARPTGCYGVSDIGCCDLPLPGGSGRVGARVRGVVMVTMTAG